MSIHNKPSFEPYIIAVKELVEQHLEGLNQLNQIIQQRNLTFIERSAVERNLQVVIESAVGCSKHYLKLKNKPVAADARTCIERIYEIADLKTPRLEEMRGAIGMRNAIVHDYLNLDWQKMATVLKQKRYLAVADYIQQILEYLQDEGGFN